MSRMKSRCNLGWLSSNNNEKITTHKLKDLEPVLVGFQPENLVNNGGSMPKVLSSWWFEQFLLHRKLFFLEQTSGRGDAIMNWQQTGGYLPGLQYSLQL